MRSTTANNVAVYQVAGTNTSKSLPDWLARKRKRSLKNDAEYANRIELIQDFEFEEASNRIQTTRDGNYCMVTGTYKPQIHVYDFSQLSLKFDRHTDAENVDFAIISDDWTKSVHLQNDRHIELHGQGQVHTRTRIPKFGRCLAYNRSNCDVLVGASGAEVYRLNLDQGRFMASFELESLKTSESRGALDMGVNCVDINPCHGLLGFGTDAGTVELWDARTRSSVGIVNIAQDQEDAGAVTSFTYNQDGLTAAAGTASGHTYIFDLRASGYTLKKDHGYGFGIKRTHFIQDTSYVATCDQKIIKIWDYKSGQAFASMEPAVDINDFCHLPNTGLFMVANEGKPMHTYYIPSIGPAPKWCTFLDSITEELEETPSSVYENYKFVTRNELQQLNLGHLVGSNIVKSYMHGFFVDQRLYDQAKLITDPYAYRDYREREIKKRLEKTAESRIRTVGGKKLSQIHVNKDLAVQMAEATDATTTSNAKIDERFKALFEDPDFEIDKDSREYQRVKPKVTKVEPQQEQPQEEEEQEEEEDIEEKLRQEKQKQEKQKQREKMAQRIEERRQLEQAEAQISMQPVSVEASELPFGSQISELEQEAKDKSNLREVKGPQGEVELSFIPQKKKKERKVRIEEPEDSNSGDMSSGRKKQRYENRRRASKNAFRGM